jgi:hypothetical protein
VLPPETDKRADRAIGLGRGLRAGSAPRLSVPRDHVPDPERDLVLGALGDSLHVESQALPPTSSMMSRSSSTRYPW